MSQDGGATLQRSGYTLRLAPLPCLLPAVAMVLHAEAVGLAHKYLQVCARNILLCLVASMQALNAPSSIAAPNRYDRRLQALEVDAYSSVHDMIHAAIISHGPQATLREVTSAFISRLAFACTCTFAQCTPRAMSCLGDVMDQINWATTFLQRAASRTRGFAHQSALRPRQACGLRTASIFAALLAERPSLAATQTSCRR